MRGIGGRSLDLEDKRALLLDSAERTFCRLGYAQTTITALAEDAGVTRPTVYSYFPSKDDVFRALADRVRREFLALQETADTSSPVATARSALAAYLEVHVRHREMLVVIAHQALSDPRLRELHDELHLRSNRRHTQFLARLTDHGQAALALPPAVLAEAVNGIVTRFADLAAAEPDRLPQFTDQLVSAYLRLTGLDATAAPTGRSTAVSARAAKLGDKAPQQLPRASRRATVVAGESNGADR